MDFSFEIVKKDRNLKARAGIITTHRGKIKTPAFSPVATRAVVRSLSSEDLKKTGSQVVLGNTYHLYLAPGVEVIKKFGGFTSLMNWKGPSISDSGGYQVSFLRAVNDDSVGKVLGITDHGVWFISYIDGGKHLITPEKSMEIQSVLDADIIMAFDQPLSKSSTTKKKNDAFERTMKWEERSFIHWQKIQKRKKVKQALFGIIQGETDKKLRQTSLKFLLSLGFPGLAIGGESIGSDPAVTARAMDTVSDLLPEDKPLHALGLGGGPEGIFEAVSRGVDIFDNSSVTRMARTGYLFIYPEDGGRPSNKFRIDIKKSTYKFDKKPVGRMCLCFSCRNYSRAYIRHLFSVHETLALRLASMHNVYFINDLMVRIRDAVLTGDFVSFKRHWLNRREFLTIRS